MVHNLRPLLWTFSESGKAGELLDAFLALGVILLCLDLAWCFAFPAPLFLLMRLAVEAVPGNASPPPRPLRARRFVH
jgi:hypothetical protein